MCIRLPNGRCRRCFNFSSLKRPDLLLGQRTFASQQAMRELRATMDACVRDMAKICPRRLGNKIPAEHQASAKRLVDELTVLRKRYYEAGGITNGGGDIASLVQAVECPAGLVACDNED